MNCHPSNCNVFPQVLQHEQAFVHIPDKINCTYTVVYIYIERETSAAENNKLTQTTIGMKKWGHTIQWDLADSTRLWDQCGLNKDA